ncbi:zinc ribbon domain-containing protein [Synechococcus sp. ATX 2A4]|uniref:zinc ribbon domain-containing protein n=1 Tax=Synechococcus sp. ATX 2A4 TaxID=2823727 RepID=UPI0020CE5DD9|nr:zinc ribbon domain-containing protein [Synechococcus sp. ATX 2A4]MCP9885739.1 zinc ribbon domain-containing protein [Synechococcus sp. ATX 2A4]
MERRIPWVWIVLGALLLLAPGPVGRLILDLLGGLTLVIVLLPFLLAGGGWVAWRILSSRVRTCSTCGLTTMALEQCPACGSRLDLDGPSARTSDRESQAPVDDGLRRSPFSGPLFNRSLFIQIDSAAGMDAGNRHAGRDPAPSDVTIDVAAKPINDSTPPD